MKINEVEALVGISKKNIRFYEEQGLLSPKRNESNGYREYGETEVHVLRRIKVFRKLGVPIEEIRLMLSGAHTVGDGMRRHMISLEREQRNLDQSMQLCKRMTNLNYSISDLDVDSLLTEMEQLESSGTSFQNKQIYDVRVRYVAPVLVTLFMVIFMTGMSGLVIWAYRMEPEESPPVWFLAMIIALFVSIGGGVMLALVQRIREIGKGEIDDARYY